MVGATACRGGGRSPPLEVLPAPRKLDGARLVGAVGTVGDGGRCDALKFFERFLLTSGKTSSVDLGRGFDEVNARRRFIIDDDVRVSLGICGDGDGVCVSSGGHEKGSRHNGKIDAHRVTSCRTG